MSFPDIAVDAVSLSGLAWLFITYGYTLFVASSLISEGSDLLLLVPAYAGIVGSCVLPVLGAVPDGAIMLFSGMGDLEEAQDQLSVGVGALAGSTIMLLTIPWALASFAGRVDIDDGQVKYGQRPKLTAAKAFRPYSCGVCPGSQVRTGAVAMLLTTASYVVIQGPAFMLERDPSVASAAAIAAGEKLYALVGLGTTVAGFVIYLTYQVVTSGGSDNPRQLRADEIIKRKVQRGELTLGGAMAEIVARDTETVGSVELSGPASGSYQTVPASDTALSATKSAASANARLADIVRPFFKRFDKDSSGTIDKTEAKILLDQLGETADSRTFDSFDTDQSGQIDFDEFVAGLSRRLASLKPIAPPAAENDIEDVTEEDDGDHEEMPDDISSLSPEDQQKIIKRRALFKLALGTILVLIFSDPMVDVMSEIGARSGVPTFYVSFVLAPLASNASELIAAYYYALKKTSKTITISFAALEGAACMNNTFCLAIFMGLVYFRGIAWQYSAETLSIVLVQLLVSVVACKSVQTLMDAFLVFLFYPLSIAFVYILENICGLD